MSYSFVYVIKFCICHTVLYISYSFVCLIQFCMCPRVLYISYSFVCLKVLYMSYSFVYVIRFCMCHVNLICYAVLCTKGSHITLLHMECVSQDTRHTWKREAIKDECKVGRVFIVRSLLFVSGFPFNGTTLNDFTL